MQLYKGENVVEQEAEVELAIRAHMSTPTSLTPFDV